VRRTRVQESATDSNQIATDLIQISHMRFKLNNFFLLIFFLTELKLVKRGEARRYRAASLAMLCNTFKVEAYTNRQGKARRGGKKHNRVSSRASDTR